MFKRQAPNILMVEDNHGDADLIRDTLESGRIQPVVLRAHDGIEALDYLKQLILITDADLPNMILLDLNLPRKGGLEVLHEIRQDLRLRHIPVIVLSSSDADADIINSYRSGANCYVLKPDTLKEYRKMVTAIEDFWLKVTCLPQTSDGREDA